jgi:hypothetical protein
VIVQILRIQEELQQGGEIGGFHFPFHPVYSHFPTAATVGLDHVGLSLGIEPFVVCLRFASNIVTSPFSIL